MRGNPLRLIGFAALLAVTAHAATVYRTIDSDGKVVYSDRPPPSGKIQKTMEFANAPVGPLPEAVLKYQADLRRGMKKRLAEVAAGPLSIALLFTTETCGYCRQAKVYLGAKGIAYKEPDIETPDGLRTFVAADGGRKGVPLLVQNDKRIVGYSRPSYDAFFRAKKVNKADDAIVLSCHCEAG